MRDFPGLSAKVCRRIERESPAGEEDLQRFLALTNLAELTALAHDKWPDRALRVVAHALVIRDGWLKRVQPGKYPDDHPRFERLVFSLLRLLAVSPEVPSIDWRRARVSPSVLITLFVRRGCNWAMGPDG